MQRLLHSRRKRALGIALTALLAFSGAFAELPPAPTPAQPKPAQDLSAQAAPAPKPQPWELHLGGPPRLEIPRPEPKNHGIEGLTWKSLEAKVFVHERGEERHLAAVFEGTFLPADPAASKLLLEQAIVEIGKGGAFQIEIPIEREDPVVKLKAVDGRGKVSTIKGVVVFEERARWIEAAKRGPQKRLQFSAGLNFSFISYEQETSSGASRELSELGLTVKGAATYLLAPPQWSVGLSAFLTALPVASSADPAARFFGLNLRAGYTLPKVRHPWRISVQGGLYYTTMWVAENAYGFRDMMGPQLFPSVSRELDNGATASAYFKFSPVGGKFSVLSLSNHEIAFGGAYALPEKDGRRISLTLDVAFMKLDLERYGFRMSSSSVSLGAAYGF